MSINQINHNAQVVFVGGGPAALWTAVQAKLREPALAIDILEKHTVYQRSHVLKINGASFRGCHPDPRIQAIVREFRETKNIRTNTVEQRLSALAQELGIGIHRNIEVTNPARLRELYPQAKVIVGADGSHSIVRRTIFNNEMSDQKDLKFITEVKYEVQGRTSRLSFLKEVYPTLKAMGIIAQEHVGKERDGRTPVTLRMFVNKQTYEHMRNATFGHPYTLQDAERIHPQLLQNIRLWLNLKAQHGEIRISGSEKITATRLSTYCSKRFVKQENGVTWCLLGDSALGVPFFKGLGNAVGSGTALSKRIVQSLDTRAPKGIISKVSKKALAAFGGPFFIYSLYLTLLSFKEVLMARIKSLIVDLFFCFIKISSYVPWQVNFWSQKQLQQLRIA